MLFAVQLFFFFFFLSLVLKELTNLNEQGYKRYISLIFSGSLMLYNINILGEELYKLLASTAFVLIP